MFDSNFFDDVGDFFVLKLDELATLFANEVVVLRVAVVVLVHVAVVCAGDFSQQPRIFQAEQCSLNGRAAHTSAVLAL